MYSFAVRTICSNSSLGDIRRDLERRAVGGGAFDSGALELALDEVDLGAGELVQRLEILVAGDPGVGDDQNAVPHVIEREHRVEQHEARFVLARPSSTAAHRFEPGGRVVAEIADRAAGEARQPWHERRVEAGHQLAQRGDERLVRLRRLSGAIDDRLAVPRAQDQERILAEERIAADVLATLDRLEQERVVGVLGDLEERRHRRQQVGDKLLADRHERAALGEIFEFFERS